MDKVIFRRFKNGEPIALLPSRDDSKGLVNSYMHVGQHGDASRFITHDTTLADTSAPDVQALICELTSIGYRLQIVKRLPRQ